MNPNQDQKTPYQVQATDLFPPFFAFPRVMPVTAGWTANADGEPPQNMQIPQAMPPTAIPAMPYGFDFMAMQAMMAQMSLNSGFLEMNAGLANPAAGFALPHAGPSLQLPHNSANQSPSAAPINASNVCATLRNLLMNFGRRQMGNGTSKSKCSMKRVPTSDAAFLSVGWSLDSSVDIVLELAKDPVGSRYVQFRYSNPTSSAEKTFIANTLLADFKACAKHACGNYTVQCLLTDAANSHTVQALMCVLGEIETFATNVYGHRVVQRALDVADEAIWNKMVQAIVRDVTAYTTHQCAHNVVQKLLTVCAERRVIPPQVLEFLAGNAASLATHPYGCRVLQKTLEVMPQSWLAKTIFPSLLPLALTLATNPYGNFVLQKMIPAEAEQIFAQLKGHIVQTAQHKYASNVLEKLASEAPAIAASTIVSEVIGHPIPTVDPAHAAEQTPPIQNYVQVSGYWLAHPAAARVGPVRQLLIDRYANYVLQKALKTAPVRTRVVLADAVRVNADQIEGLPYGRQMLQEAINVLISVGIMVPVQDSTGYSEQHGDAVSSTPPPPQHVTPAVGSETRDTSKLQHVFAQPASGVAPGGVLSFQGGANWMSPWDSAASHGNALHPLSSGASITDFAPNSRPIGVGMHSLASAASDPSAGASAHEVPAASAHATSGQE